MRKKVNHINVDELTSIAVISLFHEISSPSVRGEKIKVQSLNGLEKYMLRKDKLEHYAANISAMILSLRIASSDTQAIYWLDARYKADGASWTNTLSEIDRLLGMARALGVVSVHAPGSEAQVDVPKISVDVSRCESFINGQE